MEDELRENKLASHEKYRGGIIDVKVDRVKLPDGRTSQREVVKHPGAVAVIAEYRQRIILLRQYRYPVGEALVELPAGKLEAGEPPEDCARREMLEETGFEAGKLELVNHFYTSPGFCDEVIYLYHGSLLEKTCALTGDGEENLQLLMLTRDETWEMLIHNRIKDAKTLIGLWWLFGCEK